MTVNTTVRLQKRHYCNAFFIFLLFFSLSTVGATEGTAAAQSVRMGFIRSAHSYLGVRYLHGGTTSAGMDCSGLVYTAARQGAGRQVPRTVAALSSVSQRVQEHLREPGDLLFFNTTGNLSHVGIWLGNNQFIHAASDGPRTGVIISNMSEDYWRRTYSHSGRIFANEGLGPVTAMANGGAQNPGQISSDADTLPGVPTRTPRQPNTVHADTPFEDPYPFEGETGFRFQVTAGPLWDILPDRFPIRGVTAFADLSWVRGTDIYPGIGAGVSWDTRTSSLSIPLTASIATVHGLRFFIGTQFHLFADDALDTDAVFPGIIGLSWYSPPLRMASQRIRFYQSAEYSWFLDETTGTGFRFNTGVTFSFDR